MELTLRYSHTASHEPKKLSDVQRRLLNDKRLQPRDVDMILALLIDRLVAAGVTHPRSYQLDPPPAPLDHLLPLSASTWGPMDIIGIPPWIREILEELWIALEPQYEVWFINSTSTNLQFVLAYESKLGLVLTDNSIYIPPTGTAKIFADCTCSAMARYAWSVWSEDNTELYRSKEFTPDEVNAVEKQHGTYMKCRDTFEITAS